MATVESLLQNMKERGRCTEKQKSATKPEVLPHIYNVAKNLKSVVARHNVPIVISVSNKLPKLCARITGDIRQTVSRGKKHTQPYQDCAEAVVLERPLSYDKSYVGQTSPCVNDQTHEHNISLTNDRHAHLSRALRGVQLYASVH